MKKPVEQVILGGGWLYPNCTHEVKVTFIGGVGYCIRVFVNGELNQESVVGDRLDVSPEIKSMLRMEDKCGNYSDMASSSRMRQKGK